MSFSFRADLSSPYPHCTLILLGFFLSCLLLPYLSAVLLRCLWKAGLQHSVAGSCILSPGRGQCVPLSFGIPAPGLLP